MLRKDEVSYKVVLSFRRSYCMNARSLFLEIFIIKVLIRMKMCRRLDNNFESLKEDIYDSFQIIVEIKGA